MSRLEIYKKIFALKTIVVVGLSPKKYRASNYVLSYMQVNNFKIVPVNPNCKPINGKKCYKSLNHVKQKLT